MKKRALEGHPVIYTGLFNACAESPWPATDGLRRAHKLRKQLQEKQYIFNQTISHAMIKGVSFSFLYFYFSKAVFTPNESSQVKSRRVLTLHELPLKESF